MRILILLLALLAGCQGFPTLPGLSPYKIDIQQGNYVTQDMVDKLKPGMSRSQVRFALGTPLIIDPFHDSRWDYVYVLQKQGRVVEQRRIVVVFQDDKLTRIEGDVVPKESAASGVSGAAAKSVPEASGTAAKPAPEGSGAIAAPAPEVSDVVGKPAP
jgi:outer membrane protein assembly factor BamE